MSTKKARLTVTVDPGLVRAGQRAVRAGRAESLSGWVNTALAERIEKEQRLAALADAIALYEAEHGEITSTELALQARADRRAATVVRGRRRARVGGADRGARRS